MKEIIYLTGSMESPFFTNEIEYFCAQYDKIHVIAYSGDRKVCDDLAKKYGFSYDFANVLSKYFLSLFSLRKWKKKSYVIDEIKTRTSGSIKRRGYVYLYGIYSIIVDKIINEHVSKGNDVYLYSFWLSRPAFAIASMNIDRNPQIKRIVSRTHRYDLYEEENKFGYLPFRKFIVENLDTIYFSSKDTYEYYVKKAYSNNQSQALRKLSYLGTNNPVNKKIHKNDDKLVIVSCAYIMQRKRLDLIIEVVRCLALKGISVKWIHIGNGEIEDKIKKLAFEKLDSMQIDYSFVGKLADEEIYNLYYKENADFFINMSDSEGIPVSVIEALSMGIPAIARNVGGNADAIIDGFDGVLIEKEKISISDLKELATRIVDIYNNKELYRQMSVNAKSHWDKTFNGSKNIREVCKDLITNNQISEYKMEVL